MKPTKLFSLLALTLILIPMMKLADIGHIMRDEQLASWTLYKLDGLTTQKIATNWLDLDKNESRTQAVEESFLKLQNRVSFDPEGVYQIVLKEVSRTPDKYSFTYKFSEAEPKQNTTQANTNYFGQSGSFSNLWEKLYESKSNEERTKYESALQKQTLEFQLLLKEQDLERRENRLRAGFKRLRVLREKYNSESERMSNALGLAGTRLISHFGIDKSLGELQGLPQTEQASKPQTEQEKLLESIATDLFNRNLPVSEITVIGRMINTYLAQPDHKHFEIFRNDVYKKEGSNTASTSKTA